MLWVSIYPSAPETSYPQEYLVLSQALVGMPVVPLDTPRGIGKVVVAIMHGGQTGWI